MGVIVLKATGIIVAVFITVFGQGRAPGAAEKPHAPRKLAADFVMERSLKVLSDTITSSGKLILGGPGLLRWETTSPSKSVLVMDNSRAWIHYPDLEVTKSFDIQNDPIMKVLSEHLLALTSNDLSEISSLYRIEELPDGVKKLIPMEANVKKILAEIRVKMKNSGIASRVEMVSISGDKTTISFKNVRIDPPLTPGLFSAPTSTNKNPR